jgi:hypothetical protein
LGRRSSSRPRCSHGHIARRHDLIFIFSEATHIGGAPERQIEGRGAACQAVWLGRLFGDLFAEESKVATVLVDNKSAIQLCKNPVFHDRSKHIEVRYHFIRRCIDNGEFTVEFISTDDQLADIFTKALGRVKFQELRERIGIVEIN